MIETLLGGLLGGAFRLAPEILKWMDRNGERSHELAMQDKALEFEKLRGLLDAFNEAKKTAGLTIVKMLVTGLVMVLLAGAFLKLKLFGGGQ